MDGGQIAVDRVDLALQVFDRLEFFAVEGRLVAAVVERFEDVLELIRRFGLSLDSPIKTTAQTESKSSSSTTATTTASSFGTGRVVHDGTVGDHVGEAAGDVVESSLATKDDDGTAVVLSKGEQIKDL